MHIFSADFALEWPRPLPPNLRLVGPLLPEPAQPLPAELEVRAHTDRPRNSHEGKSRPHLRAINAMSANDYPLHCMSCVCYDKACIATYHAMDDCRSQCQGGQVSCRL